MRWNLFSRRKISIGLFQLPSYFPDKTRTLEKDIEKETKGPHRDFLLKFINTHRTEFTADEIKSAASTGRWDSLIDMHKVETSAAAIHAAGEGFV